MLSIMQISYSPMFLYYHLIDFKSHHKFELRSQSALIIQHVYALASSH